MLRIWRNVSLLDGKYDSSIKSVQTKGEAASYFFPFAPVESFLVAKVSIGERRRCGDIDRVVR